MRRIKIIAFKSLRGRLIAYFALMLGVALLLSAIAANSLLRQYMRQSTVSALERHARTLATQAERGAFPPGEVIVGMSRMMDVEVFYVPRDSGQLKPGGQRLAGLYRAVDWTLMSGGQVQVLEYREDWPNPVMLVIHPVFARSGGGEINGAIVLAGPLESYTQTATTITGRLLVAGLLALALSLIPAYYLSRRLSEPLSRMSLAAREIARGRYDHQIKVEGEDEIAELAASFNHMIDETRAARDAQREFLMSVSHDLKTPLTTIQGFSEALRDGTAESAAEKDRAAAVISAESLRLGELINDLIDVARLEARQFSLDPRKTDTNALLAGVVEAFRGRAHNKGIELSADIEDLPVAIIDGRRLRQMIGNILDNAIKFAPEGGQVAITGRVTDNILRVAISDNGPGIATADRERIFDRFFKGENSREGSGLGLAIVKELAAAMKGSITVETGPDQQTVFRLDVPVRLPDDPDLSQPEAGERSV